MNYNIYDLCKAYTRVSNVRVFGMTESIIASGYPMSKNIEKKMQPLQDKDWKRAEQLGTVAAGIGEDCFLKGIIVQFDLTFTEKAWPEAQRYNWFDIVSSMSTMHMLTKMEPRFSPYTSPKVIDAFLTVLDTYLQNPTKDNKLQLLHSYPSGLLLTARITTNYLQLKNIYRQRKKHLLPDWQEFCKSCESLPYFKELVLGE